MRAALARYANGQAIRPPWDFLVHLVAVRYGQSPAAILDWPARDFARAVAFLPYTSGVPHE